MKKLLLALCVLVVSCSDNVEISKEEYNRLKTGAPEPPSFTVAGEVYPINTGSDGHQYYLVNFYATGGQPFHYPDCLKCQNKKP